MSAGLPPAIPPMLAVLTEPFDSPDHVFELKWDGIRCLSFLDGGTRLQSRNLKVMNEIYPDLAGLHRHVRAAPCVLDGEIVALKDGKPSFLALQKRHNARRAETIRRVARSIPVVYLIFDILYARGENLTRLPFRRRREILAENLIEADQFVLTQLVPERGRDYFAAAVRLGLEGVVGKQVHS
ncbi:MAG: ATP-dependent DNA ligase, partial [Bacteroidota bacterium]